jgi:hypothetical protein
MRVYRRSLPIRDLVGSPLKALVGRARAALANLIERGVKYARPAAGSDGPLAASVAAIGESFFRLLERQGRETGRHGPQPVVRSELDPAVGSTDDGIEMVTPHS